MPRPVAEVAKLCLLLLVAMLHDTDALSCGVCDRDSCGAPPADCQYGVGLDACGCCKNKCLKGLGEPCGIGHDTDPERVSLWGTCGDGLVCVLPQDPVLSSNIQIPGTCEYESIVTTVPTTVSSSSSPSTPRSSTPSSSVTSPSPHPTTTSGTEAPSTSPAPTTEPSSDPDPAGPYHRPPGCDCPRTCNPITDCPADASVPSGGESQCEHGTILDACDCCPVCAKLLGETCSVPTGLGARHGMCADGLRCVPATANDTTGVCEDIDEGSAELELEDGECRGLCSVDFCTASNKIRLCSARNGIAVAEIPERLHCQHTSCNACYLVRSVASSCSMQCPEPVSKRCVRDYYNCVADFYFRSTAGNIMLRMDDPAVLNTPGRVVCHVPSVAA